MDPQSHCMIPYCLSSMSLTNMSHADIVLIALPVVEGATKLSMSHGYELEKGTSTETSRGC